MNPIFSCITIIIMVRVLNPEKRALIVGFKMSGKSMRETALQFHVSKSCVSKLMKKMREEGSLKNRPRSGRPKTTTQAQDNEIRRMVSRNRTLTGGFKFFKTSALFDNYDCFQFYNFNFFQQMRLSHSVEFGVTFRYQWLQ